MNKKYKTPALILDEDDPKKEFQFGIDYQLSHRRGKIQDNEQIRQ